MALEANEAGQGAGAGWSNLNSRSQACGHPWSGPSSPLPQPLWTLFQAVGYASVENKASNN